VEGAFAAHAGNILAGWTGVSPMPGSPVAAGTRFLEMTSASGTRVTRVNLDGAFYTFRTDREAHGPNAAVAACWLARVPGGDRGCAAQRTLRPRRRAA